MAISPLGNEFKGLTFDGVSSKTYGVQILGKGVFNAPKRDVQMITIPGRNGDYALDKGRFENVEVTYPANLIADNTADFAEAISDFRNQLCSRKGYCRLEDEYNPDEYRLAVYKSGLEVTESVLKAGEFNIVFECKPQRWLTSGESEITVGEYQEVAGEDNAPYLFRSSPQFSDEYDTERDEIVGVSVGFNQLVQNGDFADTSNWTAVRTDMSVSNNEATVTVTTATDPYIQAGYASQAGHKYLVTADVKRISGTPIIRLIAYYNGTSNSTNKNLSSNSGWETLSVIVDNTTASTNILRVAEASPNIAIDDSFAVRRAMVFDLTSMLGSTIADYIYTLEQGTVGSGVAFFRKYFGADYYPYDSGSIRSVEGLVSHDMVGFNQWDEEWEVGGINTSGQETTTSGYYRSKNYIAVLPNTTYYFKVPTTMSVMFYDSNKDFIEWTTANNATVTTPSNCRYLRFRNTTANTWTPYHDICINISDAELNGQYKAYEKHSYPLDSDLTLRGMPKLDASNNLYYDGDTYEADGTVTRKYGIVDAGTINWQYDSTNGFFYYLANSSAVIHITVNSAFVCAKYAYGGYKTDAEMASVGAGVYSHGGYVYIKDSAYTDATVFKASLSGVYLVYELATPTTETAQPFAKNQKVSPSGTEEYVTTSVVPVGHETQYGQDPNVIVNPTLFETSPLIECKGTGNIYLNSDQITINNLPIGDVSLASAKSSSTDSVSSSFNIDNAALLNPGDTITVASGCSTEVSFSWASSVALQSITPTISGPLPGGQVYGSLLSTTSLKCTTTMGAATFAYGTSSYYESTVSVAFEYLQSGTSYTKTCTYKVSCSYDGSNTITLSITNKTGASPFSFTSASACSLKAIKGTSTRLTTTDTIYIDLDIGEAYIINSGTVTSINDIVSIPSRLPTLKPGTNTITYANTITNLKITPRWWKV